MNDSLSEQPQGLYPIRTVSDLTGVNAITLRAWESRYKLLQPVRKASGHRLYTQEHIDLITRVVGLIDRGMRISQIKVQLDAEEAHNESVDGHKTDSWSRYLNSMVAAVIRFDEHALEEAYGEALALFPIESVTEKLLSPLLQELGRRWEKEEGSVAEEHFFSFYLRNKLGARFHHRIQAKNGPKLLLACLPSERHEIGLLLFGLEANKAGFETIILGADMPLGEIPAATKKTDCSAVVLSGLLKPAGAVVRVDLPRMVAGVNVPVFIGGNASIESFDLLKNMGIEPIGTDVKKGVSHILKTIKPKLTNPS